MRICAPLLPRSDGSSGVANEAHVQDYCLVTGAGISDQPNGSYKYMCEIELSCKIGSKRYVDDGTEGVDACLLLMPQYSTWTAARDACSPGSHLVSISSTSQAATSLPAAVHSMHSYLIYYGCFQSAAATQRAAGWAWVDGTSVSNLNCAGALAAGGNSCGLWATGEPRCVTGAAFRCQRWIPECRLNRTSKGDCMLRPAFPTAVTAGMRQSCTPKTTAALNLGRLKSTTSVWLQGSTTTGCARSSSRT